MHAFVGQALEGKEYTHVFDNFAKDVKTVETVAIKAKEWNVKNYCYVSSAGAACLHIASKLGEQTCCLEALGPGILEAPVRESLRYLT